MNELIFLLHIVIVVGLTFIWLRVNQESLIFWVAFQALLANLFVSKQIELFGLNVTCSDVYAVGSFLSLNLLQEYGGKKAAKRAILSTLLLQVFFLILSQMHLIYHPSAKDLTHDAFSLILSVYPRILIASLSCFYLVQKWDVWFFAFLKQRRGDWSLARRNTICLAISQLFDTILFSYLGLYGMVESVFDIIVLSYLIKLILIFLSTPLLTFTRFIKDDKTLLPL